MLVLLFVTGLSMRRYVYQSQVAGLGENPRFTLESALNYRRIDQVFSLGSLPEVDYGIQYPEGIVVRKVDTTGAEFGYALLARLFPKSVPLQERVRWIEEAWFSLSIPLMALWIFWWLGSRWAGVTAGSFYAVSLSSVIRSTGQEVSHENAAMPLMMAYLAFDALADRSSGFRRVFWLGTMASALALCLAVSLWDLMQYFIFLKMAYDAAQNIRGRLFERLDDRLKWGLCFGSLFVTGWVNPYLRAHAFAASPAMLLGYGILLHDGLKAWVRPNERRKFLDTCTARVPFIFRLAAEKRRSAVFLAVALLPLLAGCCAGGLYGDSYGHFAELVFAKLRFLNHKPVDPALLTFNQRIMWVPALHSATMGLTFTLFPAMLLLTLAAVGVFYWQSSGRSNPKLNQLTFFYAASLLTYCLLVRFHVFAAVFSAALLGVWVSWASSRGLMARLCVAVPLALGLAVEARNVTTDPLRWGRPGIYYEEQEDLVQWLKDKAAPSAVLANFGVSASILAYAQCPIILHPKFESPEIRRRVREYGELLFKGTEKSFRDWADEHGALYYVYALGEFSNQDPGRQMRYFVDALEPPAKAPARLFEFSPEKGRFFKLMWSNKKYRVFKILTRADEQAAEVHARRAEKTLQEGSLNEAEEWAVAALKFDGGNLRALEVLRHVGSLKDQGFMGQQDATGR